MRTEKIHTKLKTALITPILINSTIYDGGTSSSPDYTITRRMQCASKLQLIIAQ